MISAIIHDYQQRDYKFAEIVASLRKQTGPVLCENLLLCFEAGKPLIIDPFIVNSQILANRLDGSVVIDEIRRHRFSLIELAVPIHPDPDQPRLFAPYLLNQGRFNEQILTAIDKSCYEPIGFTAGAVLLTPRRNAN